MDAQRLEMDMIQGDDQAANRWLHEWCRRNNQNPTELAKLARKMGKRQEKILRHLFKNKGLEPFMAAAYPPVRASKVWYNRKAKRKGVEPYRGQRLCRQRLSLLRLGLTQAVPFEESNGQGLHDHVRRKILGATTALSAYYTFLNTVDNPRRFRFRADCPSPFSASDVYFRMDGDLFPNYLERLHPAIKTILKLRDYMHAASHLDSKGLGAKSRDALPG